MTFLAVSKAARRSFRLPDGWRNLLARGKNNDVLVTPSTISRAYFRQVEPVIRSFTTIPRAKRPQPLLQYLSMQSFSQRPATAFAFSATMCKYSFVWYTGDSG